jgi:uncharacterized membrane protein HdeD (DUF308 family)
VGAGVTLAVLGAILAFAIRANSSWINLPIVGVILMVAGAALIVHARRGSRHERVITRVEQPLDPTQPTHTVQQTIQEREIE